MVNDVPLTPAGEPATPPPPAGGFFVRKVFFNESELRAGWRLLTFVAIMWALFYALSAISHALRSDVRPIVQQIVARRLLVSEGVSFLLVLLATFVMSVCLRAVLSAGIFGPEFCGALYP
jgi:hypothetical protein